jgi:2-polyprenyl-3-methyl-5-hydroxy-6-metoxy-1,4-benzoquinol methylase
MELEKISTCPVCGGSSFCDLTTTIDYTYSNEKFNIEKCTSCTLGITNPRPHSNDISKYYQSEKYISHTGGSKNLGDILYKVARLYAQSWKLKKIQAHHTSGTILDVGCGTGEFLNYMKSKGWHCYGTEPSDLARKKAMENAGKNIFSSLIELPATKFDVITLWHVAEHLHDLNNTIAQLKSMLKPTGTILIAVPNYESPDANFYGKYWAGYDVPRHLWHFSAKAMKTLFSHTGLKLVEIIPMKLDALYISYLSETYQKPSRSKIFNLLTGCFRGIIANRKASMNKNYSSLIYIAKV